MNPAAPAPHDLIERLRRETDPFLLLLTGGRGAGKTRWCLKLLDEARAAGISAVGVLSPPVYTAGDKTAIDLLELASGQRQRLAERIYGYAKFVFVLRLLYLLSSHHILL